MLAIVRLLGSACVFLILAPHAPSEEPARGVEDAKRKALWAVFAKAKPKEIGEVTVYAETPSLTAICFVADRRVYVFSLKAGEVKERQFQKSLPRVNHISASDRSCNLWVDGVLEMTFLLDD